MDDRGRLDAGGSEDEGGPDLDRRKALVRIGAGAAVAWTTPLVLSGPAFAQGTGDPPPPDPCVGCGTNRLLNPNADAGTSAWTADWGNIVLTTRVYDQSLPAPVPAAAPNYFHIEVPDTDTYGMSDQEFEVGPACTGRGYAFSAHVANLGAQEVRVELCFCDVNHVPIDDVVVATLPTPSAMLFVTNAGTVPADTAFIGVEFWVESDSSGPAAGAFDLVGFTIDCA